MSSKHMVTVALLPTIVAFGIAFTGCSVNEENEGAYTSRTGRCKRIGKGDVYMGFLLAYTGVWPKGAAFEKGALLAIDEINAAGGIDGETLGGVACDSACDAENIGPVFDELSQDNAIGIAVGTTCSTPALTLLPDLRSRKFVLVAPSATAVELTEANDDGYLFRTAVSTALQGVVQAKYLRNERNWQSLQVLFDVSDSWTRSLAGATATGFSSEGGTVYSYGYDIKTAEYATQAIAETDQNSPDGVFIVGWNDDTAEIVKTSATHSWTGAAPEWELGDGVENAEFAAKVGNPDLYSGRGGIIARPPEGTSPIAFGSAYQAKWAEEPETYVPQVYDAVYLAAMAMVLADDPTNGEQLKAGLAKTHSGAKHGAGEWPAILASLGADGEADFAGASGDVDFDEHGDVSGNFRHWHFDSSGAVVLEDNCWDPDLVVCGN